MLVLKLLGQAHITLLAVEKLLPPADPADTAPFAMVLLLILIVYQLALSAEILNKGKHKTLIQH